MIDTVKFHCASEWKAKNDLPGWTCRTRLEDIDGRKNNSRVFCHEATGCRVTGSEAGSGFVEVSLPRLLHGNNGCLLRDTEQVQDAVSRTLALVSQVVDQPEAGVLTRLDTVWQYKGDPAQWVTALGCARHPSIRSEPRLFFGQSVEWVGANTVLRIYDKRMEAFNKPGDVVRVEAQVRGKALKGCLPVVGARLSELQFGGCWRVFRAVVGELPSFKVWDKNRSLSLAGFLSLLQIRDIRIDGIPAEDVYLNARSLRHQRRLRSQMSTASLNELVTVETSSLIPEDGPPEVVDCVA